MSAYEWETSKENIQPLRGGRKPEAISMSISSGVASGAVDSDVERAIRDQRDKYERAIAIYEGADPLAPWLQYIKWTKETFASGGSRSHLSQLLEKCLGSFTASPLYQDDIRYLRLWVSYADTLQDPLEVFLYLRKHNIGQDQALFYEAWAVVLEQKKRFVEAESVYCEGIRCSAQPLPRLKDNYYHFGRRQARRKENLQSQVSMDCLLPQNASESEGQRYALNPMTKKEAKENRPTEKRPPLQGLGPPLGGSTVSLSSQSNQNTHFQIFNEEISTKTSVIPPRGPQTTATASAEEVPFFSKVPSVVPGAAVTLKENTLAAAKWAGTKISQNKWAVTSSENSGGNNGGTSFKIFSDGETTVSKSVNHASDMPSVSASSAQNLRLKLEGLKQVISHDNAMSKTTSVMTQSTSVMTQSSNAQVTEATDDDVDTGNLLASLRPITTADLSIPPLKQSLNNNDVSIKSTIKSHDIKNKIDDISVEEHRLISMITKGRVRHWSHYHHPPRHTLASFSGSVTMQSDDDDVEMEIDSDGKGQVSRDELIRGDSIIQATPLSNSLQPCKLSFALSDMKSLPLSIKSNPLSSNAQNGHGDDLEREVLAMFGGSCQVVQTPENAKPFAWTGNGVKNNDPIKPLATGYISQQSTPGDATPTIHTKAALDDIMGYFHGRLGVDATVDLRRLNDSDHTKCLSEVFKVCTKETIPSTTHSSIPQRVMATTTNTKSQPPTTKSSFAIFQDLPTVPEESNDPPRGRLHTPLTSFKDSKLKESPIFPPTPILGSSALANKNPMFSIFNDTETKDKKTMEHRLGTNFMSESKAKFSIFSDISSTDIKEKARMDHGLGGLGFRK